MLDDYLDAPRIDSRTGSTAGCVLVHYHTIPVERSVPLSCIFGTLRFAESRGLKLLSDVYVSAFASASLRRLSLCCCHCSSSGFTSGFFLSATMGSTLDTTPLMRLLPCHYSKFQSSFYGSTLTTEEFDFRRRVRRMIAVPTAHSPLHPLTVYLRSLPSVRTAGALGSCAPCVAGYRMEMENAAPTSTLLCTTQDRGTACRRLQRYAAEIGVPECISVPRNTWRLPAVRYPTKYSLYSRRCPTADGHRCRPV